MKKILIIQSRINPLAIQGEQQEYRRAVPQHYELGFVSSLDIALPWDDPEQILQDYSAVILGGSGDLDFDGGRTSDDPARITSKNIALQLSALIQQSIKTDFPLLGICFGHQIVGEVYGVTVRNDLSQNKVGTYTVTRTEIGKADPLFSLLPDTFSAQYGHKDSLSCVPSGAVVLATEARCNTSALRFGKAAYTMQFHPELTAEDSRIKLSRSTGYLPVGVSVASIIKPSPEASKIIPYFLETIVK